MVTFKQKQIFIDGKPVFLLSGETHYFRQPKSCWQHLIDEAKAIGLNCISSYVPWILHEEKEGEYHFEDCLDLGAFIDLCAENGLYFFVRPGPFIMAEMKKEGIPYWVAHKHPNCVTVGFDHEKATGNTIDYLEDGYLSECRKWYQKVMSIIVPRLHCNGGNIIGIQLDNEIGMLNWVSNQPILNSGALLRFYNWLKEHYDTTELKARYPFLTEGPDSRLNYFRCPEESYASAFHFDYGRFLREYYAEYVRNLRDYALECGVHDTPLFVNIHGTGSGRIFDYPLGISQLYQAFNQESDLISGTDVYLGEPQEGTYQDLYVANALTDCMNKRKNPLTSIEFECGDGDYCGLTGRYYHPSATSQKMLLCLSQNARMLSFYLFCGGVNYLLRQPEDDGNGRMAFTGELHGRNAPVQPDGSRSYSFDHIARTARTIHALNPLIASSRQETDGVTLGFIPDYFLTELEYQKSQSVHEIYQNLKTFRCADRIDSIARGFLSNGIMFDAADIQNDEIPSCRLLFLLSARYMPKEVQRKLLTFALDGGKLLLYGEIPEYDLEGAPCTLLKDGLSLGSCVYLKSQEPSFFLTIDAAGSFAEKLPAQRARFAQCFQADEDAILSPYRSGLMCGFIKQIGSGTVCGISTDYPAAMDFYQLLFETLSIRGSLTAAYRRQGIYCSRTVSTDGQRLFYLMNLDAVTKNVDLIYNDELIFNDFLLEEKASLILPYHVKAGKIVILKSTAQISELTSGGLYFYLSQRGKDKIILAKDSPVAASKDYTITTDHHCMTLSPTDPYAKDLFVSYL